MKKLPTFIILLFMSLFSLSLSANNIEIGIFKNIINPIEKKVLEIKETNLFNEKLFDSKIKTSPRHYTAYFDGDNIHYRENFTVTSDGKKLINVRDVYLSENIVYCIDSITKDSMIVCDLDEADEYSAMRLKSMFFSYFEKLKTISNSQSSYDISKGNAQYVISYNDGEMKDLLFADEKTLLPLKLESRYSNGDIAKVMNFSYDKNIFIINVIVYALKEKSELPDVWSVNSTLSIKIIDDSDFDKNPTPKNFGYRSIQDRRSGKERIYMTFDKLPDTKFLDDLFKNPDDVVRYNNEIHRLAHPNEFCEH